MTNAFIFLTEIWTLTHAISPRNTNGIDRVSEALDTQYTNLFPKPEAEMFTVFDQETMFLLESGSDRISSVPHVYSLSVFVFSNR